MREAPFDDKLVAGIWEIYNESPIRQRRRFPHYGKDLETVRREEATFLDSSVFIGAFFVDKLIVFVKLVADETCTQAGLFRVDVRLRSIPVPERSRGDCGRQERAAMILTLPALWYAGRPIGLSGRPPEICGSSAAGRHLLRRVHPSRSFPRRHAWRARGGRPNGYSLRGVFVFRPWSGGCSARARCSNPLSHEPPAGYGPASVLFQARTYRSRALNGAGCGVFQLRRTPLNQNTLWRGRAPKGLKL
jgi:hypothetical protein